MDRFWENIQFSVGGRGGGGGDVFELPSISLPEGDIPEVLKQCVPSVFLMPRKAVHTAGDTRKWVPDSN